MKILSLFDGISIAQQALKELNLPIESYFASEIDKYAISITQRNFPNTIQLGDVIDIKGEDFNDIDLIIGGSPCTDLSVAKKNRQGLKGEQSKLFYDFVRLVKEVRPKYFVLENVASMAKDQKAIMEKELFGIESVMINASLVSAQNRKRIFIVGKLINGEYEKVEIPQPQDKGILLKDILESEVDEKYFTKMNFEKRFDYTIHKKPYIKKGQALRATDYKGTHNMVKIINGRRYQRETLDGGELGEYKDVTDEQIRKLTPIEAERLQSLPDNFTAKGITEKGEVDISNTQRYKALGNGFNCEVIKHIIKHLINAHPKP